MKVIQILDSKEKTIKSLEENRELWFSCLFLVLENLHLF